MKKYPISIGAVLAVLLLAPTAFGQQEGKGDKHPAEGREEQLSAIEQQLVKLKTAIEPKLQKAIEVIIARIARLRGRGQQTAASSEPQLLRKSFTSRVSDAGREYWLYLPRGHSDKKEAKWPVIMFLHGGGERGDDVKKVLKHGPIKEVANGRDLPFIIIAPQMPSWPKGQERPSTRRKRSPAKTGRISMLRTATDVEDRFGPLGPPHGWHEIEKDLIMILDSTLADYQADSKRVYLTGLSYGGFGTWYMATHHPDRWAAVAPICGAGDNSQVHKIGELPVWLFQGGRDNVVPPELSLKTADVLDAAGGNVRVTVHEDLGHDCWTRVYSGKDIYNWFLSHLR